MLAAGLSSFGGKFGDLFVIASAVLVAVRLTRGGGGSAVQELSTANRVLEERDRRREHELAAAVAENLALRARTDFSAVMEAHEERAAARYAQIEKALSLIVGRLEALPVAAIA